MIGEKFMGYRATKQYEKWLKCFNQNLIILKGDNNVRNHNDSITCKIYIKLSVVLIFFLLLLAKISLHFIYFLVCCVRGFRRITFFYFILSSLLFLNLNTIFGDIFIHMVNTFFY